MKIQSIRRRSADVRPVVAPFSLTIAECPVLGSTVAGWQEAALRECALDGEGRADLHFHWDDDVFFTSDFLRAFLADAAPGAPSRQACLARGGLHASNGPNAIGLGIDAASSAEILPYPLWLTRPDEHPPETGAAPRVVPLAGQYMERRVPGLGGATLVVNEPNLVWRIRHWSDLLVVNLVMLGNAVRELPGPGSREPSADVHPSAVVTRSRIGRNVKIGANAVVQNSIVEEGSVIAPSALVEQCYVGPGCAVASGALVSGSVLGPNTRVLTSSWIRRTVFFGDSAIEARAILASVVGSGVSLHRYLHISDSNLELSTISVFFEGRSVDTGIRLLGAGIGNGVRLEAQLAGGCEIPGGYQLYSPGIEVFPHDLPAGVAMEETNGSFKPKSRAS